MLQNNNASVFMCIQIVPAKHRRIYVKEVSLWSALRGKFNQINPPRRVIPVVFFCEGL